MKTLTTSGRSSRVTGEKIGLTRGALPAGVACPESLMVVEGHLELRDNSGDDKREHFHVLKVEYHAAGFADGLSSISNDTCPI